MKLLLPSETKVECNIKTLAGFKNYINLIGDQDPAIEFFIKIAEKKLIDHFQRNTLNKRNIRLSQKTVWNGRQYVKIDNENLKNRIREFEELMKNED